MEREKDLTIQFPRLVDMEKIWRVMDPYIGCGLTQDDVDDITRSIGNVILSSPPAPSGETVKQNHEQISPMSDTEYKEAQKELNYRANKLADAVSGETVKWDEGKLRYDLVPVSAERAIAEVMTYGTSKYPDRNWEGGIKWSRIYAAIRRHLAAWWSREDADPDSGLNHLKHVICDVSFLVEYLETHQELDDRPPLWSGGRDMGDA